MSTKRLGRGLEALIHDPGEDTADSRLQPGVTTIPLDQIDPNPHQPRQDFSEESLEDLVASIRAKGVVTPITIKVEGEKYILVAGERRWRASKMVGLTEIPAYLIEVADDAEMMEIALIENIQRKDLNPIEEAEAYAVLSSKFDLSHEAIAREVGKKRVTVSNSLRLLRLPPKIKVSLRKGEISAGHGRAILGMKTSPAMVRLWKRILKEDLSVRVAERLAGDEEKKTTGSRRTAQGKKVSPQIRMIEDELISLLGTKVKLKPGSNGGKIEVTYFSDEDLERILELLRSLEE